MSDFWVAVLAFTNSAASLVLMIVTWRNLSHSKKLATETMALARATETLARHSSSMADSALQQTRILEANQIVSFGILPTTSAGSLAGLTLYSMGASQYVHSLRIAAVGTRAGDGTVSWRDVGDRSEYGFVGGPRVLHAGEKLAVLLPGDLTWAKLTGESAHNRRAVVDAVRVAVTCAISVNHPRTERSAEATAV